MRANWAGTRHFTNALQHLKALEGLLAFEQPETPGLCAAKDQKWSDLGHRRSLRRRAKFLPVDNIP
jgi:hypothetical protein